MSFFFAPAFLRPHYAKFPDFSKFVLNIFGQEVPYLRCSRIFAHALLQDLQLAAIRDFCVTEGFVARNKTKIAQNVVEALKTPSERRGFFVNRRRVIFRHRTN